MLIIIGFLSILLSLRARVSECDDEWWLFVFCVFADSQCDGC